MTFNVTYFNTPIQVGAGGSDNSVSANPIGGAAQTYGAAGDVILSQAMSVGLALNATGYVLIPKFSDLLQIDVRVVNGTVLTAGVITPYIALADGSGSVNGAALTLSTTNFTTSVPLNANLAAVYNANAVYRVGYTTTTAITPATASLVFEVRYCIRGA